MPVGVLAQTSPAYNSPALNSQAAKLPKRERGGLFLGAFQVRGVCIFFVTREDFVFFSKKNREFFLKFKVYKQLSLCFNLSSKCSIDSQQKFYVSIIDWQTLKSDNFSCTSSQVHTLHNFEELVPWFYLRNKSLKLIIEKWNDHLRGSNKSQPKIF